MTQCTQTILGAFGSGASGSSIIRTRLLAPLGTPSHASGGETSSPSQVYFDGMRPFCWNEGEFKLIAVAAFSHRIPNAVAKRITASPERGDTCFISSLEPDSKRLVPRIAHSPTSLGQSSGSTSPVRRSHDVAPPTR